MYVSENLRAVVSFSDFLATGLQPAGEQGPLGELRHC